VQTVYPAASREKRHAIDISAAAASAAAVATAKLHTVASGSATAAPASATASPRADLTGIPTSRKKRQSLSLDEKVKLINMKESGAFRTWADIKRAFPIDVSEEAIKSAWRQRESLRKRLPEEPGATRRVRRSTFSDADRELRRWYNIVSGLGADSVPQTMAVLRARAEEIAAHLGVANFSASAGFIRRWAKRHNLVNVSLWGAGGSAAADVEPSKQRVVLITLVQLPVY